MPESVTPLIAVSVVIVLFIVLLSVLTNNYSLNGIKSKTVGDGQHGTARWATTQEIKKTFANVPFDVTSWREGKDLPKVQGLILGSTQRGKQLDALVDRDDVHCLMIGASGVGKTAFFLYPNLEFACASGMSYLALDTKGDLARNYGTIAKKYYGYHVSVIDLRNPTRSDGSNLLTLINRYMDIAREHPDNLAARAKAEKYAKILAKTIVNPGGDEQDRGQNAFFYDAAEGLLTSVTGGTQITDPATFPAADATYYAQWTEKAAVDVTFTSGEGVWNDGTIAEKKVPTKPDLKATIPGTVSRLAIPLMVGSPTTLRIRVWMPVQRRLRSFEKDRPCITPRSGAQRPIPSALTKTVSRMRPTP